MRHFQRIRLREEIAASKKCGRHPACHATSRPPGPDPDPPSLDLEFTQRRRDRRGVDFLFALQQRKNLFSLQVFVCHWLGQFRPVEVGDDRFLIVDRSTGGAQYCPVTFFGIQLLRRCATGFASVPLATRDNGTGRASGTHNKRACHPVATNLPDSIGLCQ